MKEAVIKITEGEKEGTVKINIEFVGGQMDMDALPHLVAMDMVNYTMNDAEVMNARAKVQRKKEEPVY